MKGRWACLVLMVLALGIDACGGSAHSSVKSTTTRPDAPAQRTKTARTPAEAKFISRADMICQELDAVLDAEKPKSTSLKEIVKFVPGRAEVEEQTVAKLRRLKAPRSLSAKWRDILRLRTTLAHELSEYGHAAAVGDTSSIAALAKSKARVHKELATVGASAGFNECSAVR
jgi:hypothetical protein